MCIESININIMMSGIIIVGVGVDRTNECHNTFKNADAVAKTKRSVFTKNKAAIQVVLFLLLSSESGRVLSSPSNISLYTTALHGSWTQIWQSMVLRRCKTHEGNKDDNGRCEMNQGDGSNNGDGDEK